MTARTLLLRFAFLTSLVPLVQAADIDIEVYFRNGDHLKGNIQSWDASGLTLASPLLTEPIQIDPTSVTKFSITPKKAAEEKPFKHETLIAIKPRFFRQNEAKTADLLRGQLSEVTEKEISIDTWYAGQLKIDRSMIANINIFGKGKQSYYGPNSLEEWTQFNNEPTWSFEDGTLIGRRNGHIAKDLDMSNSSAISFDYSWVGNPDMRLLLFSDDPSHENPQNYYDLSLRSNYAKLHKVYKHRQTPLLQMQRAAQLRGSGSTRVEIYADAVRGTFALFLDGEQIFIEQDRSPNPDALGGGLHLISENSPLTRIRNLQVNRWNGDIPKPRSQNSFENLEGDGERILLRNGDAIIGEIDSITDEIIALKTEYTPIQLPLDRMRSLDLKNLKDNAPIMKANDIRARFQTGGWVILDLHSITPTSITGYNQAFGTATFQLDAFSAIEFHIYEEALAIGSR